MRYPVKSMAGEALDRVRLTAAGLEDDRLYAFESSGAPAGMLRLTGSERREMLRYQARLTPSGTVEVLTAAGECFAVHSPELLDSMHRQIPSVNRLTLTREDTPQTDVRPISLISLQTVAQLASEMAVPLDTRRFRANLSLDLHAGAFAEDALPGRQLRIGTAVLLIRERVPRCRFITYEPQAPDTTEPLFSLMKLLDRRHGGRAGVYASVVTPGDITLADTVQLLA